MGRRLPGLLSAAGLDSIRIDVLPVVLADLASADAVIGLGRVTPAARAAGVLPAEQIDAWQDDLLRRDANGGLLTFGAIVVAHGVKPTDRVR
jgi:hypothetical protein